MTRRWPTALVANLLLGIPAVVPIWLLWFLAASRVSGPPAEENDGMALWLVIIVPVVVLYGLLWSAVNRPLARRSLLTPRTYWLLSALGTLLPTTALIIISP
ncbi:hypothetical protein ABT127_02680 [Streptomyces sp. NPDC001904]|uniref:hypothetical protein n=1 Tax=Streptomyces sp. NPDC001904 TaxID=3154531 RepID=UPI003332666B